MVDEERKMVDEELKMELAETQRELWAVRVELKVEKEWAHSLLYPPKLSNGQQPETRWEMEARICGEEEREWKKNNQQK